MLNTVITIARRLAAEIAVQVVVTRALPVAHKAIDKVWEALPFMKKKPVGFTPGASKKRKKK